MAGVLARCAVVPLALVGAWSAGGPVLAATWVWPVDARPGHRTPVVVRGFAPPRLRWQRGHRDVDLAAPAGAPVRAAGAGVVVFAGVLFGRGVVSISHGAVRTTYLPVRASVRAGARVAAGTVIGTVAVDAVPTNAGGPAEPNCLHWGLVSGHGHHTRYYDPLLLLGFDQVRLLPVWRHDSRAPAHAEVTTGPRRTPTQGVGRGRGPTSRAHGTAGRVSLGLGSLGLGAIGAATALVRRLTTGRLQRAA